MRYLFWMLLMALGFELNAQEVPGKENRIYGGYTFLNADRYSGGNLKGYGYSLGYNRALSKRIYGDLSYGRVDYSGTGSPFFLPKEQTGSFDLAFTSLGLGYEWIQDSKFRFSSEAGIVRVRNTLVESQFGTGNRIYSKATDLSLRIGLKGSYSLSSNFSIFSSIYYGFQVESYESSWLGVGLGYSF